MKIAVLGGTGNIGFGLAMRWAKGGDEVTIGSRGLEKAEEAAAKASERSGQPIRGAANPEAAAWADVVVLSVPYEAQRPTLESVAGAVQGKLVISAVNPMNPEALHVAVQPPEGSALEQAQEQLGGGVRVVAAFQTIPAHSARDLNRDFAGDVLVCGDDADAKAEARTIVERTGFRAIDAGPAANARVVEGFASLSLAIKKTHPLKRIGFRVVSMDDPVPASAS